MLKISSSITKCHKAQSNLFGSIFDIVEVTIENVSITYYVIRFKTLYDITIG